MVAVSGGGRLLTHLMENDPQHYFDVVGVVSSHEHCGGTQKAIDSGLPLYLASFPRHSDVVKAQKHSRDPYTGFSDGVVGQSKGSGSRATSPSLLPRQSLSQQSLRKFITAVASDVVVLAGFLRSFPVHWLHPVPVINIHPSLLPKFSGPGHWGLRAHRAALEAGVKVTGATCHRATAEYDRGAILSQVVVAVREGESAEQLADRVFEWEKKLLVHSINMF